MAALQVDAVAVMTLPIDRCGDIFARFVRMAALQLDTMIMLPSIAAVTSRACCPRPHLIGSCLQLPHFDRTN